MKNLTLSISDQSLHRARVWAARHQVSLSEVVRYFLDTLPECPRSNRVFPEPAPSFPEKSLKTTREAVSFLKTVAQQGIPEASLTKTTHV